MNFIKLAKNLEMLNKSIEGTEKLSVDFLLHRMEKVSSAYPEDKTIGVIKSLLSDRLDSGKSFITRAEFNDLYKRHYTYLSRFSEFFHNELGMKKIAEKEQTKKHAEELNIDNYRSTLLDKVLGSAFKDNKTDVAVLNKGAGLIKSKLALMGLVPTEVNVIDHSSDAMVVYASFETPKGKTGIMIPLTNNLDHSVFISNAGVKELTKENVISSIKECAGQKNKITSASILATLNASIKKESNIVEIAASKIKLGSADCGGIIGQEIEKIERDPEIKLPKFAEANMYAEKFSDNKLNAVAIYGQEGLQKAAKNVVNKLLESGIVCNTVKLSKCTNTGLMFNVVSENSAFTVPVKFAGKLPLSPEYVLSNGNILKIGSGLKEELNANPLDKKAFIDANDIVYLSTDDLVSFITKSASANDMSKCQAGLLVLKDRDEALYNTVNIGLMNKFLKKASVQHKCNRTIKRANSAHPICLHTGLPINKIASDEFGNCVSIQQLNAPKQEETGYFMTAKILG